MRRKRKKPLMPSVTSNKEEQVIEYLKSTPEFFLKKPEMLQYLEIPHESGTATSLVERQVAILRERNIDLRKRLKSLLENASTNDQTFQKMRSLTSSVIDVENLQHFDLLIDQELIKGFGADQVVAFFKKWEPTYSSTHFLSFSCYKHTPFSDLIELSGSTCTTYRSEEYGNLFQTTEPAGPGSAALIPLFLEDDKGILIIGSNNPERFSRNMETLFLDYLSEIFSKVLQRILI